MNTKKIISLTLLLALTLVTNKTQAQSNTNINEQGLELITDNTFDFGLSLKPALPEEMNTRGIVDKLYFIAGKSGPKWLLNQQFTNQSLEGAKLTTESDGCSGFSNAAKKVAIYPDKSLLLGVNGSVEYTQPRLQNEPIKKLLIEQAINKKQTFSGIKKILLSMELLLVKSDNKMATGYVPAQHYAQSLLTVKLKDSKTNTNIFIVIPATNSNEKGFSNDSKYFWNKEKQTIVCKVSPKEIWGNNTFNDYKWHKTEVDLLPIITNALEQIKVKDLENLSQLANYSFNYISFGWDVAGSLDVAVRLKGLSIKTFN